MAKQVIGIGTTPNDDTGDDIRVAFDKANDNFTELYTGAETVAATAKTTPVDADVLPIQDSEASNVKKKITWANLKSAINKVGTIATGVWNGTAIVQAYIGAGAINPSKLDDEFKTIVALGATVACDWSAGQTFTKTLSAAPTFTFSNLHIGVKFIETTGDYAPVFPTGFTYVGGTRAATGTTVYQVVCTNTSTPVGYYSILKDES